MTECTMERKPFPCHAKFGLSPLIPIVSKLFTHSDIIIECSTMAVQFQPFQKLYLYISKRGRLKGLTWKIESTLLKGSNEIFQTRVE